MYSSLELAVLSIARKCILLYIVCPIIKISEITLNILRIEDIHYPSGEEE